MALAIIIQLCLYSVLSHHFMCFRPFESVVVASFYLLRSCCRLFGGCIAPLYGMRSVRQVLQFEAIMAREYCLGAPLCLGLFFLVNAVFDRSLAQEVVVQVDSINQGMWDRVARRIRLEPALSIMPVSRRMVLHGCPSA